LQGFASAMRSCCVDELTAAVTVVAAQAPQCHAMDEAGDMADMQMAHQPMTMAMDDGGATQHGHDCSNHGACTVGATAPPGMLDPARAAPCAGARFPVRRAYPAWSRTSSDKHALRLTAR
jgi:hypothetical protein